MRIGANAERVAVSFEFFPPKTEKAEASLWAAAQELAPLAPRFVSVTYGAGGSTRERTHQTVLRLQNDLGLRAAAHLTCVEASRGEIDTIAGSYWQAGIRHIVALRGDPPSGIGEAYVPHAEGYAYADALVAGLHAVAPFEISVAAYPECHPQAPSAEADLDHLKRKIDAGACRAITQFFFDNDHFLRFRERAVAAGVTVPIVPGILPISNFTRTVDFADKCGASIPSWLADQFASCGEDPKSRMDLAVTAASQQCLDLQANGVNEFHFYTLNRAELTVAICRSLGVGGSRSVDRRPAAAETGAAAQ